MPVWLIILIIALAALAVIAILYFTIGKKAQKRMDEQQASIDSTKETLNMLIIDKAKVKLKDAGFPKIVLDSAPKRQLNRKMPVAKVKVQGRVMTLVLAKEIYNTLPIKTNVKGIVSGIYMVDFKPVKGGKQAEVPVKKK